MKTLATTLLLATLSFSALAVNELPRIDAPSELSSGAYAEGTMTQLTPAEVAEFLPWAQNAQNQLNRALTQARSMPLRDRLFHIERAVRAVVNRSGDRQYQMFMRFALNRGMLLVDELEKNIDMEEIGSQESALDILQRSIQVALSFYESDLSFQQRAQGGDTATTLNYASFGASFMQGMYPGVLNVLDATAQYRLLYKLVEMVNWDLSRDAQAARYAEAIVEAYEISQDLPETPDRNDKTNLRLIRRLNGLKIISVQALANAPVRRSGGTTPVVETPGVQIGSIQRIQNPRLSGFLLNAAADADGICKALGHQNAVPGSLESDGSVPSDLVITVDARGRAIGALQITTQAGYWVKSITCAGSGGRSAERIEKLTYPRANDMLYSSTSDANGVCISQGYSRGLPGVASDGTTFGTALVVNARGEVTGAIQIDRNNGYSIKSIYCVK